MKTTITYEDVAKAAAALEAQGKPVTQRSVRDHLGSGSMGTINPLLQKYRESQQTGTPAQDEAPMPPALQSAINALWKQALDAAHATTAAKEEEALKRVRQAESDRDDALADADEKVRAAEEAKAAEAAALARVHEMGKALAVANARADAAEERATRAEARADEAIAKAFAALSCVVRKPAPTAKQAAPKPVDGAQASTPAQEQPKK